VILLRLVMQQVRRPEHRQLERLKEHRAELADHPQAQAADRIVQPMGAPVVVNRPARHDQATSSAIDTKKSGEASTMTWLGVIANRSVERPGKLA
jgi:hypothetical protein